MKKIVLTILFLFILFSCVQYSEIKKDLYNEYIDELNQIFVSSSELPFDINIQIENLNNSLILYELTIDNAKEQLYDLETLIIHNVKTQDVFPSVGIFEEKLILSNKTDKKNNITKGIILMGYIEEIEKTNLLFRVIIKYKDKDKKSYKKFYIKQF